MRESQVTPLISGITLTGMTKVETKTKIEDLATPIEAGKLLGVGQWTLRKWNKKGVGPPRYTIGVSRIVYRRDEITDYLSNLPST